MPLITIHNAETGEIETREMTSEELTIRQADELAFEQEQQRKANVLAEREALLERLGITEEQAKLLLGK